MNKSKKSIYIVALIICFLICVGILATPFLLNRENSRALVQDSETQQSDHQASDTRDSDSVLSQPQTGSIATFHSLADIVEQSNSLFDTKRALLRVVAGASEDVLLKVFHDTLEVPNALGSLDSKYWVQCIVLTKLIGVNEAKAHMLIEQIDEQDQESVLYGVMREWSPVQTDEAIEFLTTLGSGLRSLGFRGLISGGKFLSRADLFDIGTELGYEEDYINNLIDRRQQDQSPISLDELESEFASADAGSFYEMIQLERKAVRYVLAEGLDSLPTVLELFDRVPTVNVPEFLRSMMAGRGADVVADVSKEDPAGVFEFILRLDDDIDVNLLSGVSQTWFAADPDALWNRLQHEDVRSFQAEITEEVIGHWATTNPHLVLVSMNHFPAEFHDQAYLKVAQRLSRDSPLEAIELLPMMSIWPETPANERPEGEFSVRTSLNHYFITQIISDATGADPIATIAWLNSDSSLLDDATRQQYLDSVFESWAKSDPDIAFEMALQTPLKEGTTALEATVVEWISFRDVDKAIALLPRIREGESKIEAYERIAWQLEEEERIADAIKLGNQLPKHEREEFLQTLAFSVGQRSPFSHLEAGIRELPNNNLRSQAARSALMFSGTFMSADLSDQERDQLKEFLTVDDKQMVDMMESVDLDKIKEELPKLPNLSE